MAHGHFGITVRGWQLSVGMKGDFSVVENPWRGEEAQAEPRGQPTPTSQAERETEEGDRWRALGEPGVPGFSGSLPDATSTGLMPLTFPRALPPSGSPESQLS